VTPRLDRDRQGTHQVGTDQPSTHQLGTDQHSTDQHGTDRLEVGAGLDGPAAPLESDGPGAPPRSNGELVFAEPWESRAFGMAVTLFDAGAFRWPDFQAALIARIAAWEAAPPPGECWSYYQHWLGALEDVLASDGTVTAGEVSDRAAALAHRPAGHDHRDAHGHGH
jgi:nitrile hydratase accessory protein